MVGYSVTPLPGYLQQAYNDDPRAAIAQQLTQQGMSTAPIGSWSQGLARLAQTLVGTYKGNQIRQNYQNQAQDYRTQLAQALSSGDPMSALSQSSNPELQQEGLQLQMQRAARAPQEQWRPLAPQEAQARGLNPRGSYEVSNFGQTRVVQAPQNPQIAGGMMIDPVSGQATPIPGYVQQQQQIAAASRAPVLPPDAVREYQFAKQNGFGGSFTDYQAAKAQATSGTFGGGDNGKALTILTKGDPSSPEYASAYWLLSQPKVSVDAQTGQMTTIKPDMSKFRPPGGIGSQPPVGDQGAAVPLPAPSVGGMPTQPGQAGNQPLPQVPQQAQGLVQPQAPSGPAAQPGVSVTSVGPRIPTEDQAKNNQLYTRTMQQLPIVMQHFDALSNLKDVAASKVPMVSSYLTSPDYQQANNALTDIAASYLYSVSGATANPGEVANLVKTVTPMPGESDASKNQKKQRIQEMVDSIRLRTTQGVQPGLAQPSTPTPAQPNAAQPPLQGAKQAPDGNWYVPDPQRPGKYLQVVP